MTLHDEYKYCGIRRDETGKVRDDCKKVTGGYFTIMVAIFNLSNILFSLVVLHTKSVEDYIAKFSQHDI